MEDKMTRKEMADEIKSYCFAINDISKQLIYLQGQYRS